MPLNCEVCQSKEEEILFLREMLKTLVAKQKEDTTPLKPTYLDDYGQKQIAETSTLDPDHILQTDFFNEVLPG